MKILSSSEAYKEIYPQNSAIALGSFDGVHIAHAQLMKKIVSFKERGLVSIVHNYDTDPENYIDSGRKVPAITSFEQKNKILNSLGVDIAVYEHFDNEFMMLSPEEFVRHHLIDRYRAKVVVAGFHYRFGYKGQGNDELLKKLGEKYGFETIIIPEITIGGNIVSSSLIRALVNAGDVIGAQKYLGRYFSIRGRVEHGNKIGNSIGFPTANILPSAIMLIPNNGVYITRTKYDGKIYNGITNVGIKPTLGQNKLTIETYLFDFEDDIYGNEIEVYFIDKIRDEVKFDSFEQLKIQIAKDKITAETYFKNNLRII